MLRAAKCSRYLGLLYGGSSKYVVLDRYKLSFALLFCASGKTSRRCCSVLTGQSKRAEMKRPVVPSKIERGPTELLQALADTVGDDPTGHGYQFIDDPYLLPYTERDREDYLASQAFGEAAADMVFRNMPQLFHMDTAIPRVEAFYPHPVQIELKGGIERLNRMGWIDDWVYEGDKLDRIAAGYSLDQKMEYFVFTQKVEEAIEFYEALSDEQKGELSDRARSQLFDLLGYFGNVDRDPTPPVVKATSTLEQAEKMDPTEETVAKVNEVMQLDMPAANMDDNCLARKVFKSIENKTPENFASMIKSLIKYGQLNEAFGLFCDKLSEGMSFDVTVYNAVIGCWTDQSTHGMTYDQFVLRVLTQMRDNGVWPDANTFVEVLSGIPDADSCEKLLLPSMKEMEVLGIKPTLAVYALFIRLALYSRTRRYSEMKSSETVQLIKVETIESVIRRAMTQFDPSELTTPTASSTALPHTLTFDFMPAAILFARGRRNVALAQRLFQFARRNPSLLKHRDDQSDFYRNYLAAMSFVEDSRQWASTFFSVVPTLYTPPVNAFIREVVPAILDKEAFFCLPKLWQLLTLCGYASKSAIVMNEYCSLLTKSTQPRYSSQISSQQRLKVADEIVELLDTVEYTSSRRDPPVKLNAQILTALLSTYIHCEEMNKAAEIYIAGIRIVSSVPMIAFEKILQLFWEANMLTAAEDFCRQCLDAVEEESRRAEQFVERFVDQFNCEMPPRVFERVQQGFMTQEDLGVMQKRVQDAIARIQNYRSRSE